MIAVPIDRARVRRHFERAAPGYDRCAALQREITARLLERLDLVRLDPGRVLDAGAGTGGLAGALALRFPAARVIALDFAPAMLAQRWPARSALARWLRAGPAGWPVCGDMESMPLAPASVDLVCSNLALQWSSAPPHALAEMQRVLRPGGLLMFSSLGPDSLRELRAVLPAPAPSVHDFADMHDVGDLLVRTGFADPVMDMEHVTLTYADLASLLRDLRGSGCSSARSDLPRGLRGRAWLARLERGYEAWRRDGRLPLTFEIVYGHAWKPEQARRVAADGRSVVRFHAARPQ
jgi:malonyl-CoA O-methyltransferase